MAQRKIVRMDPAVTLVISGLVSALVGLVVAVATAYFSARFYLRRAKADLQNQYESRLNERKLDLYVGFSDILRELLESVQGERSTKDKKVLTGRRRNFTFAACASTICGCAAPRPHSAGGQLPRRSSGQGPRSRCRKQDRTSTRCSARSQRPWNAHAEATQQMRVAAGYPAPAVPSDAGMRGR